MSRILIKTAIVIAATAVTIAIPITHGGPRHHAPVAAQARVEPGSPRTEALLSATVQPSRPVASRTPLGAPPNDARAQRRSSGRADSLVPRTGKRDEDVEFGEASNPTSNKYLTYRGGAVQTSPRIYLVFWGPNWFSGGDPYGVASRLHYFYQGLGGSSWANVLTQYTSNYGTFNNPSGQYQGWIQDTTPVPQNPTRADIIQAVQRAAARINDYNYNAQYVIAMPWGVVDQVSTANRWCAWHNYTWIGNSWVTYTSLPYAPYMDTIGPGCGGGRVNGTNGVLDGVTINAGHEYAETVNDPSLNAYLDSDNSENGDKCSWVNLGNRTLANGYSFPMQPTWSNLWRTQYQYGCYFS